MIQKYLQKKIYSSIQQRLKNRKLDIESSNVTLKEVLTSEPATLYLHFPFCDIACNYCRFSKNINQKLIDEYCQCLLKELDLIKKNSTDKTLKLTSIYLGGGTPSLIPIEYLKQIIAKIKSVFACKTNIQITLECHPQSLHEDSLDKFIEIGINRLSIGVQSFKTEILNEMGRPIDAAYIKKILTSINEKEFYNFNIDLIYGFDKQNVDSFLEDIQTAINFKAGHITLYPLIKSCQSQEKDNSKQLKMYNAAQNKLKQHGYNQYSVEDFARDNLFKMDYQVDAWGVPSKDLILIGTSAFGALNGYFYNKERSTQKYIEQINNNEWPIGFIKKVNPKQEHLRRLIFGMHYIEVDRLIYKKKYGVDIVKEWRWALLFMKLSGIIKITDEKILLKESQWFKGSKLWGQILFELL